MVGARELVAAGGRREAVQLRVDSGLDRQRVERGGEAAGHLLPRPLGAGHVEQDGAVGLPRGSEGEGERTDRRALGVDRRDGDDGADRHEDDEDGDEPPDVAADRAPRDRGQHARHAGSSSKPVRVMTPQTCFFPRRLDHHPSRRHHTVACR